MGKNSYIKTTKYGRVRVFEFLVVVIVIAFIIYLGFDYYAKPIESSKKSVVDFHAGIFSRMVTNLNALGKVSYDRRVSLNNVVFYLNENGWPANTDRNLSPSLRNQSAQECQQIWKSVFSNAPESALAGDGYKENVDYLISLNKNVICRYELSRKQEGSHFFDYDLVSGTVTVVRAG